VNQSKGFLNTIGHGNRSLPDFLALLKARDVQYLIDVRSSPFSKFNPQYNQNELKASLIQFGINYVFMGDLIGGRPQDPACYDEDGKVDYEFLKNRPYFLQGIERLKTAYNKGLTIALMCSESKPTECHRSKLIGKVLSDDNIVLQHIDENGEIKDQHSVILELNNGLPEIDLFGNPSVKISTSRKAYR
jgi:uncharacterized protein (DUF488 family)